MHDALNQTFGEANDQAKDKEESDDEREGSGSELKGDWAGATSDQADSETSVIARIAQVADVDEMDVATGASTARTGMTRRFGQTSRPHFLLVKEEKNEPEEQTYFSHWAEFDGDPARLKSRVNMDNLLGRNQDFGSAC